jgi:hypothetical protein
MEPLYQFATALLSAHAPWWLIGIAVAAMAIRHVGPIRLNLTIGDRLGRSLRQPSRKQGRILANNTAAPQSQNITHRLRDHGCK